MALQVQIQVIKLSRQVLYTLSHLSSSSIELRIKQGLFLLGTYIVVEGEDLVQKRKTIVEGWHPGHVHCAAQMSINISWLKAFACSSTITSAQRSWRPELFPCAHLSPIYLLSPLQGPSAPVLYCHLLKHLKGRLAPVTITVALLCHQGTIPRYSDNYRSPEGLWHLLGSSQ